MTDQQKIALLTEALTDIATARPIWHDGVGPVPRGDLEGLIQDMKDVANCALMDAFDE
jgi:hypothetical protein